jgi:hypothetical protein
LWGIGFGLPYLYHPDEPAYVLQALAIARGLPGGLTFANPPLYKYLLLAEYGVTYVLGRLVGVYDSAQGFAEQFRADPSLLYLIGRVTSALLGAATVLVAYKLAASLRGQRAGLLAAWFVAVVYLLVRESHFAVNDALVALLTTLALYLSLRVLDKGTRRDYLAAGIVIGLSFSAKYQAAVVLVTLVLAHALRPERRWRDLAMAFGAAIVAALVTFPSLLFEGGRVLQDIYMRNILFAQHGYEGMDPAGGYVYYAKALVWGLGWPLVVAAVIGMLLAIVQRDRRALLVASLPLVLYAAMGYSRMFFARYMLPAVPALIVLSVVAVDALTQALWARRRVLRRALPLAAALLVGLPTLAETVRFDAILTREDTRTLAKAWIETHLPAGAHIVTDWYPFGPPLAREQHDVIVANGWALFDLEIEEYQRRGIEYLVASSFTYDVWLPDPARDARRPTFYAALAREADIVAEFRPHRGEAPLPFVYDQIYAPFTDLARLERPGPTIKVFRIGGARSAP